MQGETVHGRLPLVGSTFYRTDVIILVRDTLGAVTFVWRQWLVMWQPCAKLCDLRKNATFMPTPRVSRFFNAFQRRCEPVDGNGTHACDR